MRIDILTLFPELLESPFEASILKRAIQSGQASVHFHNLRDYSQNKQKQVDDYPFGGGAGMVMMVEPIDRCIQTLKKERDYDAVIYLTPDGETLNQQNANRFSTLENIILLCGHYKGVDQRVRDQLYYKNKFSKKNCKIVGVSRDSIKSHKSFIEKESLNFPLLSDPDETMCNAYGVMKEKSMYGRKYMGIERSTFLISPDGSLIKEWRGVKVPGHVKEVYEFLSGL